MASRHSSSKKKQTAKGASYNAIDSPILSGQAQQGKEETAKSGSSEKELATWGSYGDSTAAQAEKRENSDYLSSQQIMKRGMSAADKSEHFDTSVSRSDKQKKKKSSMSFFRKKTKKTSGSATDTSGQDNSHADCDQIEHPGVHGYNHNAVQLLESQLDSMESQNSELQQLLEKTNEELIESKAALSGKEKLLVETKESLEVSSKNRVVWEQLVETHKRKVEELEEANHKLVERVREGASSFNITAMELRDKKEEIENLRKEIGKMEEHVSKSENLDKELQEKIGEVENVQKENKELKKNAKDELSKCESLKKELQEKNAEIGNVQKENEELKKNAKDELSKCESLKKELQEKNAEIGNVQKGNEELKKNMKNELSKCESLKTELQKTKAALQEQSNKMIVTLESANKSSSEASKKLESLQDLLSQRTAEVSKYKDKLQQLTGRDSEVTLHCKALQKEADEKDANLKALKIELEQERQNFQAFSLELDHVRQEENKKHAEEKQKLTKCEEYLLTSQNEAENLRLRLRTLEREKEMWSTKHTEEITVLKNHISELDQKLKVNTIALKQVIVKPQDILPLPSPGKDTGGQELHLAPQNVKAERSKSQMHLQSENFVEHPFEAIMHSSAPSSLRKDNNSATVDGDVETNEPEVNQYNAYESPLTSLTEVAGKVTVMEDNMTDTVKLNIQHEVVVLQGKLQTVEKYADDLKSDLESANKDILTLQTNLSSISEERAELLLELESLRSEKQQRHVKLDKLHADNEKLIKIKDQYFALLEKQSAINELAYQSTGSISHSVTGATSEIKIFEAGDDKDKRIIDLEEQLQQLEEKNENLEKEIQQLRQRTYETDIHECSDMERSLGLPQLNRTLSSKLSFMKMQLDEAESVKNSKYKELHRMREDFSRLQEENTTLNKNNFQLSKSLEYWQQRCEQKGVDIESVSKAAELQVTQLQAELEMQQKICQQREKEIKSLLRSRSSLESSLKLSKQERDRQHEQIMKLTEVKLNLIENNEKMQEAAHQSKEDATYKIFEVVNLKEENSALREEIQASKEQLETRDAAIAGFREDFEAERKDREALAATVEEFKARAVLQNQDWQEKVHKAESQIPYYYNEMENNQKALEQQRKRYDEETRLLMDQIETMESEAEETRSVIVDQMRKEADAMLKKQQDDALKECNRLTEQLQSTKDNYNSQLAGQETAYNELQRELETLQRDSAEVQTEMTVKFSLLESEKEKLEKQYLQLLSKFEENESKLCDLKKHSESLHASVGILKNKNFKYKEENQKISSLNRELECQLDQVLEQHAQEKQRLAKQLQNVNGVRQALKTQLETEVQRAEEATKVTEDTRRNLTLLSRELDNKNQLIGQLQHALKDVQDKLSEFEYKNAQLESRERERDILQSRRIDGDRDEIKQQRDEYEAKYSKLMDDYRMMQKLALSHGLRVPQRRDDSNLHPKPPVSSDSIVRPFDQNKFQEHQSQSRRPYTEYASGVGSMYDAQHQYHAPDQGSRSPGSRNWRASRDPSVPENELAQGIDHDIAEAAAHMEEREIHTTMLSMSDSRPLDANLICPLCGKQFRIGQIQHYRLHVDNCSKSQVLN